MATTEEFLARIIGHLAEQFKNKLILKGGMLLRLLNSPRLTQDLDYCWIRTKKRSVLAQEIKTSLEKMAGVKVSSLQANSRGIFLDVLDEPSGQRAKIEIHVIDATHRPPRPMSTAALASRYSLRTQVISVMDLSEACAHKIAAALERDLIRDLYDLAQLEPLTSFDRKTLEDRLSRLEVRRAKAKKVSFAEAATLLRNKGNRLTSTGLIQELGGVLSEEELAGLELVIRASISRIVRKLELG